MNIWRQSPQNKESVLNIYKKEQIQFFYEDEIISNNKISSIENKFPILPLSAISFLDFSEINFKIENYFNLQNYSVILNHL